MSTEYILVVLFILICIASIFGGGFSHKKTYTRHLKLGRAIKNYIDNFSSNSFTYVEIPEKGFSEYFDIFPFTSNYTETAKKLTHQNTHISILKRLQKKYDASISKYVKEMYRIFNTNLNVMNTSYSLFCDAYLSFMRKAFNNFTNIFANSYIPLLIDGKVDEILKADNQNLLNFKLEINKAMTESFNNDLIVEANKLYNQEMYKQFSNEDFIKDFFNSFKRSSYNNSNNDYSNENNIADEISKAYRVLEVTPDSTNDEIKKSYRKLSKKYHPDVNSSDDAQKKMMVINAAYDLLKKHRNID